MSELLNEINTQVQFKILINKLVPEMDTIDDMLIAFAPSKFTGELIGGEREVLNVCFMFVSHPNCQKIFLFETGKLDYILEKLSKDDFSFTEEESDSELMKLNSNGFIFNLEEVDAPEVWLDFGHKKATAEEKETYRVIVEGLSKQIHRAVAKSIEVSKELATLVEVKDHDLYLSFKATEDFKGLNIGLEKVHFKLPEGGDVELGNSKLEPTDWAMYGERSVVVANRLVNVNRTVNNVIGDTMTRIHDGLLGPRFINWFLEDLKNLLMAASHYLTDVYRFKIKGNELEVDSVINDILLRLIEHGGAIGLDINSWVVWDYSNPENEPVRVEEFNFAEELNSKYTESFVQAIYDQMLHTPNQYVKPYSHKTVITEDDGIQIGEIRQVH